MHTRHPVERFCVELCFTVSVILREITLNCRVSYQIYAIWRTSIVHRHRYFCRHWGVACLPSQRVVVASNLLYDYGFMNIWNACMTIVVQAFSTMTARALSGRSARMLSGCNTSMFHHLSFGGKRLFECIVDQSSSRAIEWSSDWASDRALEWSGWSSAWVNNKNIRSGSDFLNPCALLAGDQFHIAIDSVSVRLHVT